MRTRTSNLLIRSQMLYPIELWVRARYGTVMPGRSFRGGGLYSPGLRAATIAGTIVGAYPWCSWAAAHSQLSRPLRLAHCLPNPSPANRGGVIFRSRTRFASPMKKEDLYARMMHTPDDPARAELRAALRDAWKQLMPLHRALIDAASAEYSAT